MKRWRLKRWQVIVIVIDLLVLLAILAFWLTTSPPDDAPTTVSTDDSPFPTVTTDILLPHQDDPRTWPVLTRADFAEGNRNAEECRTTLKLEPDACYEAAVEHREEALRAWEKAHD